MKYCFIISLFLLVGCGGRDLQNAKMTQDGFFMAGVELDSVELGTEYRARFKRIEVPDGQDWKINISIPTREKSISKDSLEFIQLTRKDSEGYYLLEITPKLKGTWRYQVMSEYQDESGEYHLLMMRDTMRFVCY